MKKPIYILLFIFVLTANLFAQADSKFFYVGEFKITQKEKGKIVDYNFANKNFIFIRNDTVQVSPSKYNYSIGVGDIRQIAFINHGISGPVIGYSFLAGFILGLAASNISVEGESHSSFGNSFAAAFGGGLVLAIIGGGISLIFNHDVNYDLTKRSLNEKRIRLREILNSNRN